MLFWFFLKKIGMDDPVTRSKPETRTLNQAGLKTIFSLLLQEH